MKVYWSEVAEADIDGIYDYIARDVPYYAELFVDKLVEAVDTLEDYPEIGRIVPEAEGREDIRELILQRYRIIYQVKPESNYIQVAFVRIKVQRRFAVFEATSLR